MTLPNRRRYSQDFKIGAVKMVTEQGFTINEVARRLEVDRKSVTEWVTKFAPGFDPSKSHDPAEDPKAMADHLRQLRKENDRLKLENAILKKAAAYLAKEDQP
jgi:transposase-like protein